MVRGRAIAQNLLHRLLQRAWSQNHLQHFQGASMPFLGGGYIGQAYQILLLCRFLLCHLRNCVGLSQYREVLFNIFLLALLVACLLRGHDCRSALGQRHVDQETKKRMSWGLAGRPPASPRIPWLLAVACLHISSMVTVAIRHPSCDEPRCSQVQP